MTLPRVSAVVFDCDSTLSAVEGIDELAAEYREEVSSLTDAAMRGDIPLETVYSRRLELIRPDRARLEALARQYVEALVPDARAVCQALRDAGIDVRIMSGGLHPAVMAVAAALGIPPEGVAAVDIVFTSDGAYAGFDATSPLARSGGKRDIMKEWRTDIGGPVMMVGDGITDAEAAEAADVFVAYAGVVERAAVTALADVVIRSASLAPVLPLALGGARPQSPEARTLYDRGLELLDAEYRSLIAHVDE